MKITLERKDNDFHFEAKNDNGNVVHIDNTSTGKDSYEGVSPMNLVLMSVGSCSSIDIIHILKKQRQEITGYRVEVEGERKPEKEAKPFKHIHTRVFLEGDIDPEKAKRAAQLSFEKYCSVSITFEASVKITYEVVLNNEKL